MLGFFRNRRRAHLRGQPFPAPWHSVLERHVPCYQRLAEQRRKALEGHVQVLLAEKHFEGCRGFVVDDRVRVTIAAHAAILLLGRDMDYYRGLYTVLVYPGAFVVEYEEPDELGFVDAESEVQEGQSWNLGTVVLSWQDIRRDVKKTDGRNVLFHEFAHQLYDHVGPGLDSRAANRRWRRAFGEHYQRHCDAVERQRGRRRSLIDPYGAEDPSEFFAVLTELFFERPDVMRRREPALYELFARYYRQEPGGAAE